ncbi:hypothetical protein CI238_06107, partial [Colletotrichum incanum]
LPLHILLHDPLGFAHLLGLLEGRLLAAARQRILLGLGEDVLRLRFRRHLERQPATERRFLGLFLRRLVVRPFSRACGRCRRSLGLGRLGLRRTRLLRCPRRRGLGPERQRNLLSLGPLQSPLPLFFVVRLLPSSLGRLLRPLDLLPDHHLLDLLVPPILRLFSPQRLLPLECIGRVIDPRDMNTLFVLFDAADALAAQVLRKLGQTGPFRRVHVHVLLVGDVLLVKVVDLHLLLPVTRAEQLCEVAKELVAVLIEKLFRVLAHDEHLPHVRLGLRVHLEAVLIAALLLAHLAVPPQPLQAFALELVAQVLRRADLCFRHGGRFS